MTVCLPRQAKDRTGDRIGLLTVIRPLQRKTATNYRIWVCSCDCGKSIRLSAKQLDSKSKGTKYAQSCGCVFSSRAKDLTGMVVGLLTVQRMAQTDKDGRINWLCSCSCGKLCTYTTTVLLKKSKSVFHERTSCGCIPRFQIHARYTGVGELPGSKWGQIRAGARKRKIPFHLTIEQAWSLFVQQGRSCALTHAPLVFSTKTHAGATTASLDRIDSRKGYVYGNVQWVHVSINLMKQTLSVAEFVHWCGLVVAAAYAPKTKIRRSA